jgi:phosphomannomutase
MIKEPIVSISGIRGILGESLTPEIIIKYVSAFARYVKRKKVVIGRDGRLHGDIIEKLIESVLLMNGCEIVNLGTVPTPTVALAVTKLKASGGISITASHNPQEWNGLKFINGNGIFLDEDENEKMLKFIDAGDDVSINWKKIKALNYYPDFYKHHIAQVLRSKFVNVNNIRRRKFKVVLDCVNASGSFIIPELLKTLGCRVIKVDCSGSGIFTRKPEPLPENIINTCKTIKRNKADMGIVVDPDADRLVLITEKGKPYGEEYTIVTVVNRVLRLTSKNKRTACVNLSTTRAADDIVAKHSGKLFKTPVGEINVIKMMKKYSAVCGGEGSGGVIVPEIHFGRDSLSGIGIVLSEFAEFKGAVSDYRNTLPDYYIKKTKIELKNVDGDFVINKLKVKYANERINKNDGLRIDFADSWVNFRKSNTEPIVRIIAEAKTEKEANELLKKFQEEVNNLK